MRAALSNTDAETLEYLRRHCDVLDPLYRAYIGSIDRDLESLLHAIEKVDNWIASWSQPAEREHIIARVIRSELQAAGLEFNSKAKGHAAALMRAVLDDPKARVDYVLKMVAAEKR